VSWCFTRVRYLYNRSNSEKTACHERKHSKRFLFAPHPAPRSSGWRFHSERPSTAAMVMALPGTQLSARVAPTSDSTCPTCTSTCSDPLTAGTCRSRSAPERAGCQNACRSFAGQAGPAPHRDRRNHGDVGKRGLSRNRPPAERHEPNCFFFSEVLAKLTSLHRSVCQATRVQSHRFASPGYTSRRFAAATRPRYRPESFTVRF
jgi:hypothetical protein